MCYQTLFHRWFDALNAADVATHLAGTFVESSLEFVQYCGVCSHSYSQLLALYSLQMFHCHLQNVRLLQLGMACWLQ
jgi:hypothetical protein